MTRDEDPVGSRAEICFPEENKLSEGGTRGGRSPSPRERSDRAHADKSTSTVRYASVLPHTDMICELRGTRLKEALVLNAPEAPESYRFTLDIGQLAWEEAGGGLRLVGQGEAR